MATSVSISYGIILQDAREFIIVNKRPCDHQPDVLIVVKRLTEHTEGTLRLWIHNYFENFKSVLFVNGPPYKTYQMEFTSNNGAVATARVVSRDEELLADEERYREQSMQLAMLVLWYESVCINGIFSMAKAIERTIKISGVSKEKEEAGDICAICHEEYQMDEMIGTLECKHFYHETCIKKWLLHKRTCPICRAVFRFRCT